MSLENSAPTIHTKAQPREQCETDFSDDIIEPFRPQVDYIVAKMGFDLGEQPTKEEKITLYKVLAQQVALDNEKHFALVRATEIVCSSYVQALRSKNVDDLVLPRFTNES